MEKLVGRRTEQDNLARILKSAGSELVAVHRQKKVDAYQRGQSYTSWSGFAFESICQKHTPQIKKALGIEGVHTQVSTWRHIPAKGKQGAQIDLLLDRADRCINVCEMKFATGEFTIDKKYAGELDSKINVFKVETITKKTIFPTMIKTYSVKSNEHSIGRVQAEVVMGDLFKCPPYFICLHSYFPTVAIFSKERALTN